MVIVMVQQSPVLLFVVFLVLLVSGTAYADGLEIQAVPGADKTVHPGSQIRGAGAEKYRSAPPEKKNTADLPLARPGLKHSDYLLREKAAQTTTPMPQLARTTPETIAFDVDRIPVAPAKRQGGMQRAPVENIFATAWSWALIPIGIGLVLFQLRRKHRRSSIRP